MFTYMQTESLELIIVIVTYDQYVTLCVVKGE